MAAIMPRRREPADQILFNLTLALVIVGVVAVYDASYARSLDVGSHDGFFFLKRQAVYAGIGIIGMLAAARTGYWKLRRWSGPLLIIGLALLVSVWLPGIGIAKNGAHRWIGHEPFSVQPSEFAKLAVIIYLAALLSRNNYNIRSVGDGLIVPVCVIAVFAFLVEREPDLGTAAILFLAAMTVLYLAGARIKHLAALVAAAALLFILVSVFGHGFRNGRLTSFLNPEKDYYGRGFQVTRGLVAVGSGGVLGVGIGAGREKFYLPEANSDFIFATIAEEGGLWGSLIIIGLLFLVGRQGFLIARRTNDPFGSLLAAGIAAMISWQAIINVAVVTHLIPATGVPLPFISFGGSSLLFLLTGIGILLNISQHPDVKVREEA